MEPSTGTPEVDNEREAQLRRLRHENHLLRLQLLKLREEQQRLLLRPASPASPVASSAPACHAASAPEGASPPGPSITTAPLEPAAAADAGEEAEALRSRMLQRREERQQRATAVRSLLCEVEQLHSALAQQQRSLDADGDTASPLVVPTPARAPADPPAPPTGEGANPPVTPSTAAVAKFNRVQHAYDEMVRRQTQLASPVTAAAPDTAASDSSARSGTAGAAPAVRAVDDSSAEAMLQRFQDRKAQRRLRLDQMLGTSRENSGAVETPPLGGVPVINSGLLPSLNSSASADDDAGGAATAARLGTARCSQRAGDGSAAGSAPAGPTQNPNQIGRVVSDATRNNSWYLCKVLEAALLDTIQARPVAEAATASVPSQSPEKQRPPAGNGTTPCYADHLSSSSTSFGSASSLYADRTDAGTSSAATTPTTTGPSRSPRHISLASVVAAAAVAVPQLLYREGVSDTALRRAIDESLVLPFRCMQDAPRRLTSAQAADEAVAPFEAENRDPELRRCFVEGGDKEAVAPGGAQRREDEPARAATPGPDEEDEVPEKEADMLGANDENLDPFARLLLARISADLPANAAKTDKKGKPSSAHGGCGGSKESAAKQSSSSNSGASAAGQSANAKAGVASVMAAAGGDRRVHVPKKHFSRLDEVQVEMHAPVIFNQIRGFLRMNVDRFRRSFAQASSGGESTAANGSDAADSQRRRAAAAQAQQRRLRVGALAGAGEATAWRISVSPGKSGTTLLYFGDYVMKTVRPSELEFLLRKFLPAYVRYCERNPHTLLPRFYALATLRWWKAGVVQHFVLMQNVFATPYYIHRIYDVKGSTVNRTALQPGKPPPRTAFGALLLKDNDLPPHLVICGAYQRAIMLAQFRSDVSFLRQLKVVDYSCMIGVRSRLFSREEGPSKTLLLTRRQHRDRHADPLGGGSDTATTPSQLHQRMRSDVVYVTGETAAAGEQSVGVGTVPTGMSHSGTEAVESGDGDVYVCIHGCDGGLLSLPIYSPGDDTTAREDVYYLGIIDVLQTYNSVKKLESFAKGIVNDRRTISVIPPDGYAERLYKVLERITV